MNTRSLIVATLAATAILGACTSAAPTGPDAPAIAPSFELSNSGSVPNAAVAGVPLSVDEADTIEWCPVLSVDATGVVSISGTYAVAYGTCTISP